MKAGLRISIKDYRLSNFQTSGQRKHLDALLRRILAALR
jgi:hypothetical protein